MHWVIVSPFEHPTEDDRWLDKFVPGKRHTFDIVGRAVRRDGSWHTRKTAMTPASEWRGFWRQAGDALRRGGDGFITIFPQLATMMGARLRLARRSAPLAAWCFNLGACYPGLRQRVSRFALTPVARFVVHSSAEVRQYAEWLRFPEERFQFVPLQCPRIEVTESEDTDAPFVLSMGTARRDYAALFEAVRKLGYRTIVVAGGRALEGLDIPGNVEVRSGVPEEECHRLAQRARINVVPVMNHETASGQVTIVTAMHMGRAVVATRCIGSEDYVIDGETGLLTAPGSSEELAGAIGSLWTDGARRAAIAGNARQYAEDHFSDEAAGDALGRLLDGIADSQGR